jgi:hypothetical protein
VVLLLVMMLALRATLRFFNLAPEAVQPPSCVPEGAKLAALPVKEPSPRGGSPLPLHAALCCGGGASDSGGVASSRSLHLTPTCVSRKVALREDGDDSASSGDGTAACSVGADKVPGVGGDSGVVELVEYEGDVSVVVFGPLADTLLSRAMTTGVVHRFLKMLVKVRNAMRAAAETAPAIEKGDRWRTTATALQHALLFAQV